MTELTEAERRILLMAYRDGVLDPGQAVLLEVERIIDARLAPIRALADEWDNDLGRPRSMHRFAAAQRLRAALNADLTAPRGSGGDEGQRVHNYPSHRTPCSERLVDGQLRGACLNDDGSPR